MALAATNDEANSDRVSDSPVSSRHSVHTSGLYHTTFAPNAVSRIEAREHEEIWHVRGGRGRLRRPGAGESILRAGVSVVVPAFSEMQVHTDPGEPLDLMVLTIPARRTE
jgi:mannose-6-phosphate isomerase-like protein (cupin superfamily)